MDFIKKLIVICNFVVTISVLGEEPYPVTAYINSPGQIDLLMAYSTYSTDHFWNKEGKKLSTFNHFHRKSCFLYLDYAFDCRNSFLIKEKYSFVKESLNRNSQGFNDVELRWKSLLYQGNTAAFSSQVVGIIPVGDHAKSSIRYAKLGIEGDLLFSDTFSISHFQGNYTLELGYRHYQGFPSDQIRANAFVWMDLTPYISLIATTHLDYGLFNGSAGFNQNNIACHPNYRLLEIQLECVVTPFSYTSFVLGAFKHIWGRNIGTGGGMFCGAWFTF